MSDSIELDDIEPFPEAPDFRRANGAPMVVIDGKNVRLSRPSSFGKRLDDESALTNWRINKAIAGVAMHKDLAARAAAAKEDDRKTWQELRDAAIQAGRGSESADLGTALHAMSERWEDPNDDFDPPEVYAASLRAYSKCLDELGLVSDAFEFKVVNTEFGAAGTCDRLYIATKPLVNPNGEIVPVGTLIVGDLKTGQRLDYSMPGYSIQMALYASGQFYDVVNDEFLDTPEIYQEWGILVHMPVEQGSCEMLWVDLRQGEYGAGLAKLVMDWRKDWRKAPPAPVKAMPSSPLQEIRKSFDAQEIDALPWIRDRLAQINTNDDAKRWLLNHWPEGVPSPKNGLSEPAHVEQVLKLLDDTEARYQLSFIQPTMKENQ